MSSSKNDLKKFIKKNLLLIISVPIFLNSGVNFFQKFNLIYLDKVNFVKIISFILGTLFFVYLSNFLNNHFFYKK